MAEISDGNSPVDDRVLRMARRLQIDHSAAFRQFLARGGLLMLVLLGLIFALVHDETLTAIARLGTWIESLGNCAPLAVIALMIVHCFIPFPAEVLALCAWAIFGTLIGAVIGAALLFGLAILLGHTAVMRLRSRSQQTSLNAWAADQGALTMLVSRFIPIIAFNLINYAAGLTNVCWRTFLSRTAIGILPLTLLMAYVDASECAS